jgi:hypothetical protein
MSGRAAPNANCVAILTALKLVVTLAESSHMCVRESISIQALRKL